MLFINWLVVFIFISGCFCMLLSIYYKWIIINSILLNYDTNISFLKFKVLNQLDNKKLTTNCDEKYLVDKKNTIDSKYIIYLIKALSLILKYFKKGLSIESPFYIK